MGRAHAVLSTRAGIGIKSRALLFDRAGEHLGHHACLAPRFAVEHAVEGPVVHPYFNADAGSRGQQHANDQG